MKKIIQRMCIACNTKKDKKDLIRIVINKKGEILIDKTGKLAGRGVYMCYSLNCFEEIKRTKKLEKFLGFKLGENFYEELKNIIVEN